MSNFNLNPNASVFELPQSAAVPVPAPLLTPAPKPKPAPVPAPLPKPAPKPAPAPVPKLASVPATVPLQAPSRKSAPVPAPSRKSAPKPDPKSALKPVWENPEDDNIRFVFNQYENSSSSLNKYKVNKKIYLLINKINELEIMNKKLVIDKNDITCLLDDYNTIIATTRMKIKLKRLGNITKNRMTHVLTEEEELYLKAYDGKIKIDKDIQIINKSIEDNIINIKFLKKDIIIPKFKELSEEAFAPRINYHSNEYCNAFREITDCRLNKYLINNDFNNFADVLFTCLIVRYIKLHHYCFTSQEPLNTLNQLLIQKCEKELKDEKVDETNRLIRNYQKDIQILIDQQKIHIKIFNNLYNLYLYFVGYRIAELKCNFTHEYELFTLSNDVSQKSIKEKKIDTFYDSYSNYEHPKLKDKDRPVFNHSYDNLDMPIIFHRRDNVYLINGDPIKIKHGIDETRSKINKLILMDGTEIKNKMKNDEKIYPWFLTFYEKIQNDQQYDEFIEKITKNPPKDEKYYYNKYLKYKNKYLSILKN